MKSLRKAYRGEKGFTLVELLVVVVILGVLAAVAVLAVTRFMGRGNLESARTELHQAQTAIAAVMADAGVSDLDATATGWTGGPGVVTATDGAGTVFDAADSLLGSTFRAGYNVAINGEITLGDLTAVTNPWSGIAWDGTTNGWIDAP